MDIIEKEEPPLDNKLAKAIFWGKVAGFTVQELKPDMFDECLHLIEKYLIPEEAMCVALGMQADAQSSAALLADARDCMRDGTSIVVLKGEDYEEEEEEEEGEAGDGARSENKEERLEAPEEGEEKEDKVEEGEEERKEQEQEEERGEGGGQGELEEVQHECATVTKETEEEEEEEGGEERKRRRREMRKEKRDEAEQDDGEDNGAEKGETQETRELTTTDEERRKKEKEKRKRRRRERRKRREERKGGEAAEKGMEDSGEAKGSAGGGEGMEEEEEEEEEEEDGPEKRVVAVLVARVVQRLEHMRSFSRIKVVQGDAYQKWLALRCHLQKTANLFEAYDIDTYYRLYHIVVHPDHRKKGVGSFLVRLAALRLAELFAGHGTICTAVAPSRNAQRLLARQGFRPRQLLNYHEWKDEQGQQVFNDAGVGNYNVALAVYEVVVREVDEPLDVTPLVDRAEEVDEGPRPPTTFPGRERGLDEPPRPECPPAHERPPFGIAVTAPRPQLPPPPPPPLAEGSSQGRNSGSSGSGTASRSSGSGSSGT